MIAFSHFIVKQTSPTPNKKQHSNGKSVHLPAILWAIVGNLNFLKRRGLSNQAEKKLSSYFDVLWCKNVNSLWRPDSLCNEHTQDETHINKSLMAQIKCKLHTPTEGKARVPANDLNVECVLKCNLVNTNYRANATTEQSVYKWCRKYCLHWENIIRHIGQVVVCLSREGFVRNWHWNCF